MNLPPNAPSGSCTLAAAFVIALTVTFIAAGDAAAQPPPVPRAPSEADTLGAGKQKLNGYRRPDFAKAPLVGPLEPDAILNLAIVLPMRNPAALEALAAAVSDPKSPSYRKFIAPEQTIERFSPTVSDYDKLTAFAKTQGLTVSRTHSNRVVLDVWGTAEIVQKAFRVQINKYRRPDGSLFFALDREPSLDTEVPVLFVAGLENYVLPRSNLPTQFQGHGFPATGWLVSADFRNVYAANSTLKGEGQSVGILAFGPPDPLNVYGDFAPGVMGTVHVGWANYNPPAWPTNSAGSAIVPPIVTWPPTITNSAGTVIPNLGCKMTTVQGTACPAGSSAGDHEAELDIEMVLAMAPGLTQINVYTANAHAGYNQALALSGLPSQIAFAAVMDSVLNAMATPPLSLQLSSSLSWAGDPGTEQILRIFAVQGQSFFTASGDFGAYYAKPACSPFTFSVSSGGSTYMSSAAFPYTTVVGGTMWSASPGSTYNMSEISWNGSISWGWGGSTPTNPPASAWGSGGGIVTGVPMPSYQTGFATSANGGSTTYRNVPDVSAAAANVQAHFGFLTASGGTSSATPLWAGFAALVNQQREILNLRPVGIGFLNPTLYKLATSNYGANFNDITYGNNTSTYAGTGGGTCPGYNATTGYDLVTGLGSPTGQLIYNLATAPVTPANRGDPHITTTNGTNYDFQSAGEFVSLRDSQGMEIQTRQTPVPTAEAFANANTGLASCVSVNTAVAARVGNRRVTYQPNPSGAPGAPELRVDGVVTTLPANGINLGPNSRIIKSPLGSGIQIDFPNGTNLIVTEAWWQAQRSWYLDVDVYRTPASEGIMGPTAAGSWLPSLPNGISMGPLPAALPQRHADLYQKFADAWRVTNATSLFDYAPGTLTADFTVPNWPPASGACAVAGGVAAKPLDPAIARNLCARVADRDKQANCVFDVTVTGEPGFAKSYLLSQRIEAGLTRTAVNDQKQSTRFGESASFTATVALVSPNRKGVPAGLVQFTRGGENLGAPVKLDAKARAILKTSRLPVGDHQIAARYIPARRGVFLASSSFDSPHSVVEKPVR